ncbi:MAG: threonine/serine dehydratase [Deltaproteobacteria bacterium]|jgi:threonine dehydratase|nr:threonine/serine dehydratase [Deltaproteobacteria bacterium]MBT4525886.1 threonine/serine dehydratase [Deltaproteobacteria bacterium]
MKNQINSVQAYEKIRPFVLETPLINSLEISDICQTDVFLKCEHLQYTGSFKLRGATNKILSLSESQKKEGVISASTGNHGQGIALAAGKLNVPAVIYTPSDASPVKLKAIKKLGASVKQVQGGCGEAEDTARKIAEEQGITYISPYNDPDIIAGQGTIGVELSRQLPELDAVFISVGGGGLISGIGNYLKQFNPKIKIIGCWPENSAVMYESLKAGLIIEAPEKPTISDGTAGPVEFGSITFPICANVINQQVLLTETEIKKAMRLLAESDRFIVEGAAGVALAGLLKLKDAFKHQKVAVVLCGRNILFEKYLEIMNQV